MSQQKPTVLLEHYLKELKLPTFLREYKKIAELCRQDRSDYQTFLLRLVEREIQDREIRARERRIKAAKFPVIKTLDSFDFKAQPSINQSLVRELMRSEYIDQRENVARVLPPLVEDEVGVQFGDDGPAGAEPLAACSVEQLPCRRRFGRIAKDAAGARSLWLRGSADLKETVRLAPRAISGAPRQSKHNPCHDLLEFPLTIGARSVVKAKFACASSRDADLGR